MYMNKLFIKVQIFISNKSRLLSKFFNKGSDIFCKNNTTKIYAIRENSLKMVIMTYGFMQHSIKKEKIINKGQVLICNNRNLWVFLIILECFISHIVIGSMLVPIQIFSSVQIYFLGKEHRMV